MQQGLEVSSAKNGKAHDNEIEGKNGKDDSELEGLVGKDDDNEKAGNNGNGGFEVDGEDGKYASKVEDCKAEKPT